jgi:hypothetical protein
MLSSWQDCALAIAGHKAVQNAGVAVLPMLSDQSNVEYQAYLQRATFFNATKRTLQGLSGMIFRKQSNVVVPPSVQPMLQDIDMTGNSLEVLAKATVNAVVGLGRAGLFLDYPTVDTTQATQADAKRLNFRPMIKLYDAFSITNWKTRVINSISVLSLVVLKEINKQPIDEFTDKDVVQYRVLDLFDVTDSNGVVSTQYRVRVMEVQKDENTGEEKDVVVEGPFFPKLNGKQMDFIPFQFVGPENTNWQVCEPPLLDLVEVNLSHFRVTADYEHGCHFTGLPTPVISGYVPENQNEKFYIGSLSAWVFPNASAKAAYLEFTGQGLTCLRTNLEDKKKDMAVLGARMLEAEPTAVQSANTAAIHRGGEQSMLAAIAETVSTAIQRMLGWFCQFANASATDVKFRLNKDFFPIPMDSLTLTAIVAAWQNQAIDFETMIDNLKSGEIVDTDATAADIQAKIKANPPPLLDVPTTPGDRAHNGPAQGAATGTTHKGGATSSNPTQTQLQNS